MDALYAQIIADRDAYDKVVHLRGDSIMRGKALKEYEDGDPPLDPSHPLYRFRSIASTANWALDINNRPRDRFAYAGALDAEEITLRIQQGVIRAGDVVVLEDAGDCAQGISQYYTYWKACRAAVVSAGITCVMMTTPDYLAPGFQEDCQFDLVHTNGPSDSGTLNDAIRRAATVTQSAVHASWSRAWTGRTFLIDMNDIMDTFKASCLSADGVLVFLNDNIHPNVWGQMRYVMQLMGANAADLRKYIADVTPMQDLAAANWEFLAYYSTNPAWNANRARTYVAMLKGA